MSLHLSRIRLRREGSAAALARLLVPDGGAAPRSAAGHHLLWSLFADHPERQRDFLWREERPGDFLALSARAPQDAHGLFSVETKPFEPVLGSGDRLRFSLRANPTIDRAEPGRARSKRHDVVMNALKHVRQGERGTARPQAILTAGAAWMARQGTAHGFAVEEGLAVDGYDQRRVLRDGARDAIFGVADFEGALRVNEPAQFLAQLGKGFGRARAFGCGLMLIRRMR